MGAGVSFPIAYLTHRILHRCPKIFAVTCYHVVGVAAQAVPTKLVATPAGPTITFSGANTPGTLVQTNLTVTATGATKGTEFDVFYVTTSNNTIADIASNFADRINAAAITGVHAGVGGAKTAVTLQAEPIRVSSWRRSRMGMASTLRTLRPGCHPVDDSPLSRMFPWRDALVNVKGDTHIRWQRKGFRLTREIEAEGTTALRQGPSAVNPRDGR